MAGSSIFARFRTSRGNGNRRRHLARLIRICLYLARISGLGALTASIVHEVNQPLAGIVANAGTCLRLLEGEHAQLDGARETARRMIRDANRVSDMVTRLRGLFARKAATIEMVNLNDLVREVIDLRTNSGRTG